MGSACQNVSRVSKRTLTALRLCSHVSDDQLQTLPCPGGRQRDINVWRKIYKPDVVVCCVACVFAYSLTFQQDQFSAGVFSRICADLLFPQQKMKVDKEKKTPFDPRARGGPSRTNCCSEQTLTSFSLGTQHLFPPLFFLMKRAVSFPVKSTRTRYGVKTSSEIFSITGTPSEDVSSPTEYSGVSGGCNQFPDFNGKTEVCVCVRFTSGLTKCLFNSNALQLAKCNPNWLLCLTHTLPFCTSGAKHYSALLVSSNTNTIAQLWRVLWFMDGPRVRVHVCTCAFGLITRNQILCKTFTPRCITSHTSDDSKPS